MGVSNRHHRRSTAIGEIVELQGGGRILRSTGRKDRHSKVCTAKGPRDRRVRLSALTAIQFYDVQDRLGFDRPSKAVDWLIQMAKSAIDELDKLPSNAEADFNISNQSEVGEDNRNCETAGNSRSMAQNLNSNSNSSFLPPSLDSDAIADTIKSFFPIEATAGSFPSPDCGNRNQDLKLTLQTFQDPVLFQNPKPQVILSGIPLGFDTGATWAEQSGQIGRFHRLSPWNFSGGGAPVQSSGNLVSSPFLGRDQVFAQRGTLQSSNTPSIRTWINPSMAEHSQQQSNDDHQLYPSPGFTSGLGGFTGLQVPVRIQGDDNEEHVGYSNKLSSASFDSR